MVLGGQHRRYAVGVAPLQVQQQGQQSNGMVHGIKHSDEAEGWLTGTLKPLAYVQCRTPATHEDPVQTGC